MSNKYNWKNIIIISVGVLLGISLRIYFLWMDGYSTDIYDVYCWFKKINDSGFWSLYSAGYQESTTNYPPIIPIVGSLWFRIPMVIKAISIDSLFFKILPTIFELALTIFSIFIIVKSKINGNYKNLLISFVILQPGLAFVSSGWGQFDSVVSLFIFVAIYMLWKDKLFLSTFIFYLATLTKPQAALAVFTYFAYLAIKKQYKNLLIQAIFFLFLMLATALIFKICGNSNFFGPYLVAVDFMTVVSVGSFNLWWTIFAINSYSISDSSFKLAGLSMFLISIIPALIYLRRKKTNLPEIMLVFGYIFLAFFILPTQVHERYLYYGVAMISIASIINYKFFILYIILSINLFLNCAIVLRSNYPHQLSAFPNLHSNVTTTIAFINLLVFVSLFLHFWFKINNKRSFFDNDKKIDLEKIYPKT